MNQEQKSVSIVMTTYNGGRYVADQIRSILAQTYPIGELIVQDDGSTDQTLSIVEAFATEDSRVKLYRNAENLGWNRNFISAIKKAQGDFIALSDQDDIWFPEKIEKLMAGIGSADLCFCYRYKDAEFTTAGKLLGKPQPHMESLLFTSHIPGHDMLLRRSFVEAIETWHDRIPYDWWLALQSHLHRGIACVAEPLGWHRPHADSASAQLMKEEWARAGKTTWQPYIYGWEAYRLFQQMDDWRWLYGYLHAHTTASDHRLVHTMTGLMLRSGLTPLLRLCSLSLRHREKVHERYAGGKGLQAVKNGVRAFFYPLIWAYNNNSSFIQKPRRPGCKA